MSQPANVLTFLDRLSHPGSLEEALAHSLEDEAHLRRLFATDKLNERLKSPFVGLIDVFAAPDLIRKTRARVAHKEDDLSAKYVMPLSEEQRRKDGDPCMVANYDEFHKNFLIFTEGSLGQLDWSNVVVAGGSVLACLSPVPQHAKTSKRALRKWFHNTTYPTSDVDLFVWGLTDEEARAKIKSIYETVRDSVPWDVTCVRTKHAVSIHSQYPYRTIQIVLRLYTSPAEILAGFDVDAPCCAYDGKRVWANPRSIVAMMRQCNTVDMTRRSPSYEVRLAKYSYRNFEISVPNLRRADVDPTIYERSIVRIQGLARLLVLEKLANPDSRVAYLDDRRKARGRPNAVRPWQRTGRKYKGDLKSSVALSGLEMNDYDLASLHIPYGPGWDARRIEKLIYQTDLGMNSPFNPKNKHRVLHRHPAFFGTMEECIEDCCEHCPQPKGEDEKKLQEEEDTKYLRGRIEFIQEDPGRQSISGSFHPIDEGEWSHQAYAGETERFFTAIAACDRTKVATLIQSGTDVNRRDHVGRAPLHLAIMVRAADIVSDLVDAGARMTARLVDGRTSLHLAAQVGHAGIIVKLLDRSALNAKRAEEEKKLAEKHLDDEIDVETDHTDSERASSEDDWSSDSSEDPQLTTTEGLNEKSAQEGGEIPEDVEDELDVFDISIADWDLAFTALGHGVASGSLEVVEELLSRGADPSKFTRPPTYSAPHLHPLTLTSLVEDKKAAAQIAARLISAGAASSTVDGSNLSIFHRLVRCGGQHELVASILASDSKVKSALNHPFSHREKLVYPIVSAIGQGEWGTCAVLMAYGAKMVISEEDASKGWDANRNSGYYRSASYPGNVCMPVEVALACHDDIIHFLIALGAQYNLPVQYAIAMTQNSTAFVSLRDHVFHAVYAADELLGSPSISAAAAKPLHSPLPPSNFDTWKSYVGHLRDRLLAIDGQSQGIAIDDERKYALAVKPYIDEVRALFESLGAKTWDELYPDNPASPNACKSRMTYRQQSYQNTPKSAPRPGYCRNSSEPVPIHLTTLYNDLFEACWADDNQRIQQLCLPGDAGAGQKELLQITVTAVTDTQSYEPWGYSPLVAAVLRQHYDTAQLILDVAAAQYDKDIEARDRMNGTSWRMSLPRDEDSDGSSDDAEYDSDNTVEQGETKFTDLAQKPSAVKCAVKPEVLLQSYRGQWPSHDGKTTSACTVLGKAVEDGDTEAFVKIAALFETLEQPASLSTDILNLIVRYDRPEMLDEFIHRTGYGVPDENNVPEDHEGDDNNLKSDLYTDPAVGATKSGSKRRSYLGLTVHGKKRKDLASKGDPDAKSKRRPEPHVPLLWFAAQWQAIEIVEYLGTDRPASSYKKYASTHRGALPRRIRQTRDLAGSVRSWVGWDTNMVNESPLHAAILGGSIDVIKKLFTLDPRLMKGVINAPIKFAGLTPLLLAVYIGSSTEVIEFLLEKGANPEAVDRNGWNFYHLACVETSDAQRRHDAILYLLQKLPAEVSAALLAQQSRKRFNTPLHLAVKQGVPALVRALLKGNVQPSALHLRDCSGATPLHLAVLAGTADITRLLLDASCATNTIIEMESGTGDTPLELAVQRYLISKTQIDANFGGTMQQPPMIDVHNISFLPMPVQADALELERRLSALTQSIAALADAGRLPPGGSLATVLEAFVRKMEGKLHAAQEKVAAEAAEAVGGEKLDPDFQSEGQDCAATLRTVREALAQRPGPRELVHLVDVQIVVRGKLDEQKAREQEEVLHAKRRAEREEALAFDTDEVEQAAAENSQSVVQHLRGGRSIFEEDTY